MPWIAILLTSSALAADAFAVSISAGCGARSDRAKLALRMGIAFGFFQAAMPLIGWGAGIGVAKLIADWDHWIAFALLAFVGGKMIHESFAHEECRPSLALSFAGLVALAIATSIDALAVGFSFTVLGFPALPTAGIIGCVTAALSASGVLIGHRFGDMLGKRAELVGGLVLIGIGLRILAAHLAGI